VSEFARPSPSLLPITGEGRNDAGLRSRRRIRWPGISAMSKPALPSRKQSFAPATGQDAGAAVAAVARFAGRASHRGDDPVAHLTCGWRRSADPRCRYLPFGIDLERVQVIQVAAVAGRRRRNSPDARLPATVVIDARILSMRRWCGCARRKCRGCPPCRSHTRMLRQLMPE